MAIIPFRIFRAIDLEILVPNSVDEEIRNRDLAIWRSWGELDERISVGYTACFDGIPIAALGIRFVRPGVGTAWAYFTKEAEKHKFSLLRSAKLMLKFILEACDYKKVRASVRLGFPGADVLARHLGFKKMRRLVCGTHDYYLLKVL